MGAMEDIKRLRELTNLGVMDCKKALEEAKGDFDRALEILKSKGIQIALKKSQRTTREGLIESYVHFDSKVGSMVEIDCETDFVARTDDLKRFARDVCMQITASDPLYVGKEDVPEDVLKENTGQDADTEEEFYKKYCLLEQDFIKDPSVTIKDSLTSLIGKIGENIVIKKFVRFEVGKE